MGIFHIFLLLKCHLCNPRQTYYVVVLDLMVHVCMITFIIGVLKAQDLRKCQYLDQLDGPDCSGGAIKTVHCPQKGPVDLDRRGGLHSTFYLIPDIGHIAQTVQCYNSRPLCDKHIDVIRQETYSKNPLHNMPGHEYVSTKVSRKPPTIALG